MDSEKIKCLIIDDDPFIRDLLQDKLDQFFPEVEVLVTAGSGTEGLQKIGKHNPDLIFLDVEMADMTGFEMLARLEEINFQTIFITSYRHYAIKAIHFNALDYLVKPIDLEELKHAISRYKDSKKKTGQRENLKQALHNYKTKEVAEHMLIMQAQEGEFGLVIKDIIRVEGKRNYSYIWLKNNRKKLVTKTLSDLEELLGEKGFFRIHKSFLVNFANILPNPGNLSVILSDGVEVPISRRKKEAFRLWFEELSNRGG